MKAIRHAAVLAASLTLAFAAPAIAQEFPLTSGEYVEVTSVTVDDGHNMDYAMFLAGRWREQRDFMKAQGWISSYEVLANINKRPGEPDLYLIQRSKSLPDGAESERRDQVLRDKVKMTTAQLEAASGDRAKFRHIIGSSLLQVLNFK